MTVRVMVDLSDGGRPRLNRSIADLTDQRVLALTNLQMDPYQDSRRSVLLNKQQAGQLTEAERSELWALMQVYQEQLLQKA